MVKNRSQNTTTATATTAIIKMLNENTRAAGCGTIGKAAESPDESIMEMRFDHGLCVTCSAQLFEVTETGGCWMLNPVTTPGVAMNGRCIYCHPEQESNSVKEEEQNSEDAATVPVEEVETGEDIDDQSLSLVIALDGYQKWRFVGVVSVGNAKKGKGIFYYEEEAGEHKGKSIVYEGEFADGFFEGHGSLRDQGRGSVAEGQWNQSKLNGHCKQTFGNGTMYEGEMKNDMRYGRGTCTYANGPRYEGDWKRNEHNGQGTYTWVNGNRYQGEFNNNSRNGHGKMVYNVGVIYEGNWKDDKRNGRGTKRYANGRVKVGTWKKGKFVG
jgi:hypothetical protein